MITNSSGAKVSAKEAAKEALAQAVRNVVADPGVSGGFDMTEKEAAKLRDQLEKISARLLAKLTPAASDEAAAPADDTAAEADTEE